MDNWILSGALLVSAAVLAAGPSEAAERKYTPFLTRGDTSVSVNAGLRQNNFDWNIAGDITGTQTPNILSELTWENITLVEGKAKVRHSQPVYVPFLTGSVQLEAEGKAGLVASGDNQDSDYNGNDRTDEFSRSNNSADEGYSLGAKFAVGYQFDLTSDLTRRTAPQSYFFVTPLVGYGWDRQLYKMIDGNQTIPALGRFGGLDSEYEATWFGPFVGMEVEWQQERHLVRLRGEYHDLDYDAEAVWNLRDDFKQDPSYTHEAEGEGYRVDAEYAYAFDQHYVLTVNGEYEERSAEDGIDTTFFSNGNIGRTKLNEVNDESLAMRVGMRYHW